MFETKSELRKIATATTIISALALSLTGCAVQLTDQQKTELTFTQSKFVNDTYVEGFTPGAPDYGITMEMLMQRAGLYDDSATQKTAISAILEDGNLSGSATKPTGYLFDQNGIKLDLTGKFAFTSAVLKADNKDTRNALLDLAEASFESNANQITDFAIAWLTLGLEVNNHAKAAVLADALVAAQNTDGGFDDYTLNESTTDATGLALLALATVKDQASVKDAISKAEDYLAATILTDHFESYGSANVNGTAYAFMGLKAVGASATTLKPIQTWLATQLQKDGGVQAGFAPGTSDVMATSQALLAINGRNYLDLL